MDNFKIIYKILKALEKAMDLEEFDNNIISAESLNISEVRWCRIMSIIASEGYVSGVETWNSFNCEYPRVYLVRPAITLKGLEYLEENSLMKKAAEMAKGVMNIIP